MADARSRVAIVDVSEQREATHIDSGLTATLSRFFRRENFRPNQLDVINASLSGLDVFFLWGTGAGKFLCF